MELDEHVPVYVPKPEHPEYHVSSNEDMQSLEDDSIDYLDEHEDDDEDPEEDPKEDHTDYPADEGDIDDEPSDDDDDDDDTNDEDEEPTEDEDDDEEEEDEHLALTYPSMVPVVDPVPSARDIEAFETDESAPTPRSPQTRVSFSQTCLRRARKTVRLEPPMSASMKARIAEHVAAPIPPTSPAYDQAPLVHRTAMIRMRDDIPEEDMPPRRRFVLTSPSSGERPEDCLQDMLHEVRQAYLSFEARNRALLARLEMLDTHMSHMEWQRQGAEDLAVRHMMRIHVLEARAQIDTVEDTGSSC
nr:hypothetical protein [Tanacetum cinerariifolium]